MPEDTLVLCRNGKIVWAGSIGALIEDVEFDRVIVHLKTLERLCEAMPLRNKH